MQYWIKDAQKGLQALPKNQIECLDPFEDEDGLMRVSGRLKNSKVFDVERKHPKILPANHPVSRLIVRYMHEKTYHPGHLRVMAECRKEYWIIGLRRLAKRIASQCVICRWWRGKTLEQKMSDLPEFRITPGSPFENCSVDYFGHFLIRYGRRQRVKAYGAIFTCLVTRAVHVELVSDMTTDRFLMALRRLMSLYGKPKFIRSDNGKNFVGAARELKLMLNRWRNDVCENNRINEFISKYTIKWTFSIPLASHHNGAVEAMVKTVKNALNKVIKEKCLTSEEYQTIFCEITECVNSRPLWPTSDGDLDQPPITCNDLLRPGGLEHNSVDMNMCCNPRKRYQYIQSLVNEWWKLWIRYFVPNLQPRSKWLKKRENLSIGDMVLLKDEKVPRGSWTRAIVEEIYPGPDKLVRSVKIRTSSSTFNRPIHKLILLLSKEEMKNCDET